MADIPPLVLVLAGLLGVGLLALVAVVASRCVRAASPDSPGRRLAVLMRQRPDYTAHVGVPPDTSNRWARALRLHADAVEVEGHGDILLAEVHAFAVA